MNRFCLLALGWFFGGFHPASALPGTGHPDLVLEPGTAWIKIGENSWRFDDILCRGGEGGDEFELRARAGTVNLRAGGNADVSYVELDGTENGKELNFTTAQDPNFVFDGSRVTVEQIDFIDYGASANGLAAKGTFKASCP